jgi:hypothetical protein
VCILGVLVRYSDVPSAGLLVFSAGITPLAMEGSCGVFNTDNQ